MRDLNWDLLQLQRRSGAGSHATRRDRAYALAQMANALHELGYRGLRASGLKGKHIEALVRDWSDRGLSDATMMNRMAHVRWWADQVGKGNMVKANAEYGIQPRSHVSDGARRRDLDEEKLALVTDSYVRMALRLQAAFGLRREEAIKFSPSQADRGDRIAVKASTAKGGRAREVPVLKDSQSKLLDEARRLAGGGAMIPPDRNYAEQRKVYEEQTRAAGLDRMHGLRHAYALDRYEDLTGWKAPAAGGPARRSLTGEKRRIDTAARKRISRELGHGRIEIVRQYCG
ncbi:MAG: integrase domain-containing protein [Gammaproteobacteria bacterium]|nr:integrase domain-containing protein [Gammaproteobacteria bacterium]